ncbi:MAG: DUF5103 domain-containing protein [Ignavibacteriales bacterium]|nr:DUF5103 domain-containing protein [Ignavibacteriales bacterium]
MAEIDLESKAMIGAVTEGVYVKPGYVRRILAAMILSSSLGDGQEIFSDRIVSLRVNGVVHAGLPACTQAGQPLTIEFDARDTEPQNYVVRFTHCDRDWHTTNNVFVNDELKNHTKVQIPYQQAPPGIKGYGYTYVVRVPGIAGVEEFAYSGNYRYEISDAENGLMLARGRMFVIENGVAVQMRVGNRGLPSTSYPGNQVHKVEVKVKIPETSEPPSEQLFSILVEGIDVVRNRELNHSYRIDAHNPTANAYVEDFGLPTLKFVLDNVLCGNEYRRLDLRNVDFYPAGQTLRSKAGADVLRFKYQGAKDNNGKSTVTAGDRYAEVLPYRFELLADLPFSEEVFVLGDFNGWEVRDAWKLQFDAVTHRYYADVNVRRGVYDYQYVFGDYSSLSLEGSDWRTVSVYSVFVYYRDQRYGGFDRIIGFAQQQSSGGSESSTR